MASTTGPDPSSKADHLCVLVHGLWGTPKHLENVAKTIEQRHPADTLRLLVAQSNASSLTYDGIELGGERVCAEIEEEMKKVEEMGGQIKKLSIIGYSLGGLFGRYAVGMLYAKGILDTVECKNFITLATPHLGVRAPIRGLFSRMWNLIGSRTLSESGRQIFVLDKFRDTGRPLLAVMADPSSIFISGLRRFERRSLYTNIVNDRTAVHYTTSISKTDPYDDLDMVDLNYLDGYEQVILHPDHPYVKHPETARDSRKGKSSANQASRLPFLVILTALFPLVLTIFLTQSVFKTISSNNRIKLHEAGKAGINIKGYRVPLLLKELRGEMEHAYETVTASQPQDYLETASTDEEDVDEEEEERVATDGDVEAQKRSARLRQTIKRERRQSIQDQPTLALAPEQFEMADGLNAVGWRKYPVHIQHDRHSHAAIIVRFEKKTFDEGYIVLKHLVETEFLL